MIGGYRFPGLQRLYVVQYNFSSTIAVLIPPQKIAKLLSVMPVAVAADVYLYTLPAI